MKVSLQLLILSLLAACGTAQQLKESQEAQMRQFNAFIGSRPENAAPVTINNASIKGNYLIVEVSYSGGCGEHTFECIGSRQISKSLPPRRSIELIHLNHGDMCKKLITEKLKIDLNELAYQKEVGSEIYLDLVNWEKSLHYVYSTK